MPQADLDRKKQQAARREEEFLAEELHDTVCPTLAGVSLILSSVIRRQERGKEPTREELEKLRSNVDSALEQLRLTFEATVIECHPERLHPLLEKLSAATARRVPCDFSADDKAHVSDGLAAYAFYRTARIFIHIAIKAGGANQIHLRLTQEKKTARFRLSYEGTPVLSSSFATADEKLLEGAIRLGRFRWRIDSGTVLVCDCL